MIFSPAERVHASDHQLSRESDQWNVILVKVFGAERESLGGFPTNGIQERRSYSFNADKLTIAMGRRVASLGIVMGHSPC